LTLDRPTFFESFEVLVGKGLLQKRFTLHNDLFLPRSEFFRAARSATCKKDSQKPTTLDDDDDDPEVFANYMQSVYLGDVTPLSDGDVNNRVVHDRFDSLIALWVLADKLGDLEAANLTIDTIVSYSDEVNLIPGAKNVSLVYRTTVNSSPLRTLMRDLYIHDACEDLRDDMSEFGLEFYRDVACKYLEVKRASRKYAATVAKAFDTALSNNDRCLYHSHSPTVPRCTPSPSTPMEVVQID
jgi:hypothetical protein